MPGLSKKSKKLMLRITTFFVVILLLLSACSFLPGIKKNAAVSNNSVNASGNTNSANTSENTSDSTQSSKDTPEGTTDNTQAPDTATDNTKQDGTVLVKTVPAGQDYLDETLFLGDSNTAMFLKFKDAQGQPYCTKKNTIGVVSVGIEHIESLRCMSFSTGLFTMAQSAAILQPRRIIIMFGTNDLKDGASNAAYYADLYATQIKAIQSAYPYADIIVNSVLPSTKNTIFYTAKIDTIRAFNEEILKMCTDNGWKFMNSFEAFIDSTGYADPQFFEYDGLHLNAAGVETMFSYIRSHALYTEDRRPAQRSPIPEINGPLIELLAPMPGF